MLTLSPEFLRRSSECVCVWRALLLQPSCDKVSSCLVAGPDILSVQQARCSSPWRRGPTSSVDGVWVWGIRMGLEPPEAWFWVPATLCHVPGRQAGGQP